MVPAAHGTTERRTLCNLQGGGDYLIQIFTLLLVFNKAHSCVIWRGGVPCYFFPQPCGGALEGRENLCFRSGVPPLPSPHPFPARSGNECRAIRAAFISHAPQDPGFWEKRTAFCGEVGACGNLFPAFDKQAKTAGDFFSASDKHESCATNSFPAFNETLARAEISSRQSTRRWNARKFFPVSRRDAGVSGNSFPALNETLARAEILFPPLNRILERTEILSCASGCAEDTPATNRCLCGGKIHNIRRHL